MSAELTKEDYIVNYIKSLATIEEAMIPYRDQRKDLRKSYVDNGWLEEISCVLKNNALSIAMISNRNYPV